jgi:hypothetical protein
MNEATWAIIGSSAVGLAGVLSPALSRRAERKHDLWLRLINRRGDVYKELLHKTFLIHEFDEGDYDQIARHHGAEIRLWGSGEVRSMMNFWLNLLPQQFPDIRPTEVKAHEVKALERLRQQMSDEVQGIRPSRRRWLGKYFK